MKLKNHLEKRGRRIQKAMSRDFGISAEFLLKCCQGDTASLQELGQMGKEGALVTKLMPKIKTAALSTIQGTEDLNVGMAEIIQQAATSSLVIGKASSDLVLANQSYINQRNEIVRGHSYAVKKEALRHSQAVDIMKLDAWLDKHMTIVDGKARLLQSSNRLELRQMDADLAYEAKVGEHVLKYGDDSKVELIPQKNYLTEGVSGIIGRIKNAILGF
ncbi:hypothetical protein BZZ01_04540 [Nostocales cyanobacterium HT-58-2]|nr:hypothetical protein BZZ01_04540 [Nostocales cyanobacterium HT-58-2]